MIITETKPQPDPSEALKQFFTMLADGLWQTEAAAVF